MRLASIEGVNSVFLKLEAYVKNTEAIERSFTSFGLPRLIGSPLGELSA